MPAPKAAPRKSQDSSDSEYTYYEEEADSSSDEREAPAPRREAAAPVETNSTQPRKKAHSALEKQEATLERMAAVLHDDMRLAAARKKLEQKQLEKMRSDFQKEVTKVREDLQKHAMEVRAAAANTMAITRVEKLATALAKMHDYDCYDKARQGGHRRRRRHGRRRSRSSRSDFPSRSRSRSRQPRHHGTVPRSHGSGPRPSASSKGPRAEGQQTSHEARLPVNQGQRCRRRGGHRGRAQKAEKQAKGVDMMFHKFMDRSTASEDNAKRN